MINFIPFRIFRGPPFHKPVTGQELFFAVSYSKPALESLNFDHAGILQRSENVIHRVFNAIPGAAEARKTWLGSTFYKIIFLSMF